MVKEIVLDHLPLRGKVLVHAALVVGGRGGDPGLAAGGRDVHALLLQGL